MSEPLQWTIIATQVPPGGSLGGVVRYTTELMAALAARDDVQVSAVTTAAAADTVRELLGGTGQVTSVPNLPVPLLSVIERNVALKALRNGPDVVHGIKHLVPKRSTALRVLTVHDLLLLDRPEDFGLAKRLLLPRPYKASLRDADLLVCVSDATRQRLEAHVRGAAARSAVVHLATSHGLRTASSMAIPALAGQRFALVVGDSSPRKNLATVMQAWDRVCQEQPGVVLAIAGPPSWGETAVGDLYDSLVASGQVIALGHVPDAQLRWAYENADVVLCPSIVEGFGLPVAEAMHFGAPVIVSDDPALVEVADGRARAIVPPLASHRWAGAIVEALNHPDRRIPAPTRTWADVAADTVAAVREALARRQHASAAG